MKNHERYKNVPGSKKYFFHIDSDNLNEDFVWIKANEIENIKLISDVYKLKTIEPILELNNIKSLDIFLENTDLSKLCEFKELQDLAIGESNYNINVSGLSKLRELYLLYHKQIKGLNTLTSLEKLIVVKPDENFFVEDHFKFWLSLNELALLSPKLPASLSFLKSQQNLRELEIFNSRSGFNIEDLVFIKNSLSILKIGSCKNVSNVEKTVIKLKNLKWFALTDSITLNDSSFVNTMPNLETLIVLGSSYFLNGNLSNLKGKLKYVSIDNKKHYNLKHEDFLKEKST